MRAGWIVIWVLGFLTILSGCPAGRRASSSPPRDGIDPRLIGVDTLIGGARVYLETEVDKPAVATSGGRPVYPPDLKAKGVQGDAEFRFVVDTTGVVEASTIHLITASHPEFAAAGRDAISTTRFIPAVRASQRVRMWTVHAIEFRIRR